MNKTPGTFIQAVCVECGKIYEKKKDDWCVDDLCSEKCRVKVYSKRGLSKAIDIRNTENRIFGIILEDQDKLSRGDFLTNLANHRTAKIKSLMLEI